MDNQDDVMEWFRNSQFNLAALLSSSWVDKASQLRRSAGYLYEIFLAASSRQVERMNAEARNSPRVTGTTTTTRTLEGAELEDYHDQQLLPVVFMLLGLSLETLCKGILVGRKEITVTANGKVTGAKTHDLIELFRRCRMAVSDGERDVLHKLTHYVEWMGKYPVPLDRAKMWPLKTDSGWLPIGETNLGQEPMEITEKLYDRAADVFIAEYQPRRTRGATDNK